MAKMSAYNRRKAELEKLKNEFWQLETKHKTIVFDNKMLQEEYDKMKAGWDKLVADLKNAHQTIAVLLFVIVVITVWSLAR